MEAGSCWVKIYGASPGDAPLVICEGIGGVSDEASAQIAAEVVREHFPDRLPSLPVPLLWIEYRPPRRRGPGKYFLLIFSSYEPRPATAGFISRLMLGKPEREPLSRYEVASLIGESVR